MADPEAVKLAKENGNGADLHKRDLSGADLRGADLIDADLSEANLEGANLEYTDLEGANLRGANLRDAILITAYLKNADLENANLRRADLEGAALGGANLTSANVGIANLTNALLNYTDLINSDFTFARLESAQCQYANFDNANFYRTILSFTDLSAAKNLAAIKHLGPSSIDFETLRMSGNLPKKFLEGCGLPDAYIEYLPSIIAASDAISFYSTFISYSHADKAFATKVHDYLQDKGIRCWRDEKQILPGDEILDSVNRGIRMWDKVILCASEESLTSWWCDNEIDVALQKEQKLMKERKKKTLAIIPLNLDGFMFSDNWQSGKRDVLKSRNAANFKDCWDAEKKRIKSKKKFEEQIELVVKALRADGGGRDKPPAPKL